MSWLDDMEAADPAYPDPSTDPWSDTAYVPDTSRGLPAEVGTAIGEWARQQNSIAGLEGPDRPWLILDSDGNLLADYRTKADRDRNLAEDVKARDPVSTSHWDAGGCYGPGWSEPEPLPLTTTGPDWRAVRQAQAHARDAGLRATVPRADGEGTPKYQADATAWGTGRGIDPDGPEAG
jgi:hypothetical protein